MKKTNTFKIFIMMTLVAMIFALPSVAFGDQAEERSDETILSTELSRAEKELLNGKKVTVQGKSGSVKYYYIFVPSGAKDLVIKMSGGTGDADLYTKFGSKPDVNSNPDPGPYDDSRAKWDCRPYKDGNDESCSVDPPKEGKYYAAIKGYKKYTNVKLTATYVTGEPNPEPTPGKNELINGESQIVSGNEKVFKHYFIDVTEGMDFLVAKITGGDGDADLHLQKGKKPNKKEYLCRPYKGGNAEQCVIENPAKGRYFVSLFGYSKYTDVSIKGAFFLAGPTPAPAIEIQSGDTMTVSAAKGEWKYYSITVPEKIYKLRLKTTGGSGNADLFRKFGQSPTLFDNDRYSINPDNNESMTVSNSGIYGSSYPIKTGTYYIGVYGDENFSDMTLTVSYE